MPEPNFDSLVVISFGGPENPTEVIPFLENVLRGKNVPHQRMLEVAEHYYHFGGKSPINDQNRELVAAVREILEREGPAIPVYWGNRNWHPFLADTLRQMRADGCRRALAFATSAFSSYSGCRQYLEDIVRARTEVGDGAIEVEKLRIFYNHPRFIAALTDRVRDAFSQLPNAQLVFTAHSIPSYMAQTNDYEKQLKEACRLVGEQLEQPEWTLAYQSRSGPPNQPWLGPDIVDTLREIRSHGVRDVVVAPIGFISDHMEVLYDLDTEARAVCVELGLNMVRAGTVGVHPEMAAMIRELVMERLGMCEPRAIGKFGPHPDACREDCCPGPVRHAPRLERVR
ncbi:MAG TPA: ferrochelatase [Bryobacteraceae bacterium]|nr:ferrochelatase [Bryobacteraceae bacterium]